jgi:hypothetical protein
VFWHDGEWVLGRGLDHEGAKGAKDTKHEEREGVGCRVLFLGELRASCSSRFVFFAGLRLLVIQTSYASKSSYVSLTELCEQAPGVPGGPAHHGVPVADQNEYEFVRYCRYLS